MKAIAITHVKQRVKLPKKWTDGGHSNKFPRSSKYFFNKNDPSTPSGVSSLADHLVFSILRRVPAKNMLIFVCIPTEL